MRGVLKKVSYAYLLTWLLAIFIWKIFYSSGDLFIQSEQLILLPSWQHPFGTDALGRDLFLRVLDGGFISTTVGLLSSVLSLFLACLVGVVWTWYQSKSFFVNLVIDLLQAIPSYVTASLVFTLIQYGFSSPLGTIFALSSALAFTHWMNPARFLRAQTLQLKVSTFVEAAQALGATPGHILRRQVPNHLKNSILVLWSLQVPILLMYESFMSFIGFGIEAPYTSWGLLMQEGWRYLSDYPHLLLGPGLVLFTVLLALNYILDSFRNKSLGPRFD